jgi:hypothetical protein
MNKRDALKQLALMGDPSVRKVKPAHSLLPGISENPAPPIPAASPAAPLPEEHHAAQPADPFQQIIAYQAAQERRDWLRKLVELKPRAREPALVKIHAKAVRSAKRALGVTRSQDEIRQQGRDRARRFRARKKEHNATQQEPVTTATVGVTQLRKNLLREGGKSFMEIW